MKLNKLFFILAAFVALTFAACSKDGDSNGSKDGIETNMAIKITMPSATYADPEEIGNDATIAGGVVTMAIFSEAGVLEVYSATVAVTALQTSIVTVTSGKKYVYILANVPASIVGTIPQVVGTTTIALFEKSVQALTVAEVSATAGFFMANLNTPVLQNVEAGVTNPVTELKNILRIEIGRLAARVQTTSITPTMDVHENGTPGAPVIGTISTLKSKIRTIAQFSYLIGQPKMDAGLAFNATPYYDGLKGTTIASATDPAISYDDYENGLPGVFRPFLAAAPVTHADVDYVLENSNSATVTGIRSHNTTRLSVQGVVIPAEFVNLTTGVAYANPTPVAATFYTFIHNGVKYVSETKPVAETWFATLGVTVISEHINGLTYYRIRLAVENPQTRTHTIMRNHVYKVSVTKVKGIGTATEDEDPDIIIEGDGALVVDLVVVPWTVVNQPTEI